MTDGFAVSELLAQCDRLFNAGDQDGVGRLLHDGLEKALRDSKQHTVLLIYSELMGHHRMRNERSAALQCAESGVALLRILPDVDKVTAGTILINAGTVYSAFGDFDQALQLYQEAEFCYNGCVAPTDRLRAALFNNMAAAYMAKHEICTAELYYLKALDILKVNNNLMDSAVTCVNLARLYAARDPEDDAVRVMLESALMFMDDPAAVRDGYYAHTCNKCVSVFREAGMNDAAGELEARAKEIYAGN